MKTKDWKRHEEAKRLRSNGMTLKAVGETLGVSVGRVRHMLSELDRKNKMDAYAIEKAKSDAELASRSWWGGLSSRTSWYLERVGIKSRDDCIAFAGDDLILYRGTVVLPALKEDRRDWSMRDSRLSLEMVNEIRAWLGVHPYVPPDRVASAAEINRAKRLLEQHGWRVDPPASPQGSR
jgi:hypothetical protein